jgi:hypothetical protein
MWEEEVRRIKDWYVLVAIGKRLDHAITMYIMPFVFPAP